MEALILSNEVMKILLVSQVNENLIVLKDIKIYLMSLNIKNNEIQNKNNS